MKRVVLAATVAVVLSAGLALALGLGARSRGQTRDARSAAADPAAAVDAGDDADLLTGELRSEPTLLIARKGQYRMRLYARGKLVKTYVIGLGQSPIGHKQVEGDNRTPEGRYRIIQKAEGPFAGAYGAYLGPRWLRINYPNDEDAEAGLRRGLVTPAQVEKIRAANRAGTEPPKDAKLGSGIGIHGWAGKWPDEDQQNLTWGCLSLQNPELIDLYDRVTVGTPIVIFP
jgi:murein L,D-transpeptidase YafK